MFSAVNKASEVKKGNSLINSVNTDNSRGVQFDKLDVKMVEKTHHKLLSKTDIPSSSISSDPDFASVTGSSKLSEPSSLTSSVSNFTAPVKNETSGVDLRKEISSPVSTPLSTLTTSVSKVKSEETKSNIDVEASAAVGITETTSVTIKPESSSSAMATNSANENASASSDPSATSSSSSSAASSLTLVTAGPAAPASTLAPVCQNCATSTTPLWRRDEAGQVLCNACGLFLKLHGRSRPISLKTDVIKSRNRIKNSHRDSASSLNCNSGPASYPNSPAHGPIMSPTGSLTSSPRLDPQGNILNDKKSKKNSGGSKSGGRKSTHFGSSDALPSLVNLDHSHGHSQNQSVLSYGPHLVMNSNHGHPGSYPPNGAGLYLGANPYPQHLPNIYSPLPGAPMTMQGPHHSPPINHHNHPDLSMYPGHMVMATHSHPHAHVHPHTHGNHLQAHLIGHHHSNHSLIHHFQSSGANTPTGVVSPSLAPIMNQSVSYSPTTNGTSSNISMGMGLHNGSGTSSPYVNPGGHSHLVSRLNNSTPNMVTSMSPVLPAFHTISPYGNLSSGPNSPAIKAISGTVSGDHASSGDKASVNGNKNNISHLSQSQSQIAERSSRSDSGDHLVKAFHEIPTNRSNQNHSPPLLKSITSPLLLSVTPSSSQRASSPFPSLSKSPSSIAVASTPSSTLSTSSTLPATSSISDIPSTSLAPVASTDATTPMLPVLSFKTATSSGKTTLMSQATLSVTSMNDLHQLKPQSQCLPQRTALDHLSSAASQSSYLSGQSAPSEKSGDEHEVVKPVVSDKHLALSSNLASNIISGSVTPMPLQRASSVVPLSSIKCDELATLRTRVAELELVNDLFKSRVAELEVSELSARRSEAAIRETEIMLRNNLYRLENRNLQITEKNKELRARLKEFVPSTFAIRSLSSSPQAELIDLKSTMAVEPKKQSSSTSIPPVNSTLVTPTLTPTLAASTAIKNPVPSKPLSHKLDSGVPKFTSDNTLAEIPEPVTKKAKLIPTMDAVLSSSATTVEPEIAKKVDCAPDRLLIKSSKVPLITNTANLPCKENLGATKKVKVSDLI